MNGQGESGKPLSIIVAGIFFRPVLAAHQALSENASLWSGFGAVQHCASVFEAVAMRLIAAAGGIFAMGVAYLMHPWKNAIRSARARVDKCQDCGFSCPLHTSTTGK